MSNQITTAFVQQYKAGIVALSQQKGSRFRNAVMVETGVVGKNTFMDQIGATTAVRIQNRHGDTPLINTPHRRRRITLFDYNWADLVDSTDKLKLLTDPTSAYSTNAANALGRAIDDEVINAAFATAATGEDGTTNVTWPAGNVIAVNSWAYGTGSGNAGLTISKLIEAKVFLMSGEAADEPLYFACSAKQIGNLLATTEATSSDYAAVKALVNGEMNTFMGFTFIRSERLLTSSSNRRCIAFAKSGLGLAFGEDIKVRISERADKNYSTQVYCEMSIGASRLEEAKVCEVLCAE